MFGGIPRLLYIGTDQWRPLFLIGILLLVIGGGIAVVAGVPMEDETNSSSVATITVEQQHHAQTVEDASIYPPGSVLRGKSLYLFSDAPTVTIREVVRSRNGPPVIVDVETRIVYQVRYTDSVIYNERGVSARENGEITDGNVTVHLDLDMPRVRNQLQGLSEEFGGETSVEAILVTRVEYSSQSSGSIKSRTPVKFTSKGYHIPVTTERAQYREIETSREPVPERTVSAGGLVIGNMQLFGLILAIVGLIVVGVSIGYLRHVPDVDKEALYREMMHQRFSELIAQVESGDSPVIDREMESLQDLVFVGDDAVEPVLYFPDEDLYIVEYNELVYGYQFES